jgi:hypothetical protein
MNLIRLNLSTCEMLTYLWLEMNLLVLIMSILFLQVSSQPTISLLFFYYAVRLVRQPGACQVRRPGPAASSQAGPAAPRIDGQQPTRTGGKAASQVLRSRPATTQPRAAPRPANQPRHASYISKTR